MKSDEVLKVIYKQRDKLIPYARNSRTHSEEQVMQVAASIREFGWTNPVLINGEDGILAGHARVLAAIKLSITDIPCIDLSHLTESQQRAYVIADNKLAENAGWDLTVLETEFESLIEDGFELDFTGFDQDEREKVHKQVEKAKHDALDGQQGEDDFGTVPMNPITRPGDVWHLGPHRLICGDSLAADTLQVLVGDEQVHMVLTDPPTLDLENDKLMRPFFEHALSAAKRYLPWFGHAYLCCNWHSWPTVWDVCKSVQTIEAKNLIVWDKGDTSLGPNYGDAFELIAYFSKLPDRTIMDNKSSGERAIHKPNVMRHSRPTGEDREHNAAKPVALFRDLIYNSSGPGDVILEPFCGSGTTIIAADQTDRICLAVDIEPKWCDVTIGRFIRLRETPVTLDENGPTYQEVAQQREGDAPKPKQTGTSKKNKPKVDPKSLN